MFLGQIVPISYISSYNNKRDHASSTVLRSYVKMLKKLILKTNASKGTDSSNTSSTKSGQIMISYHSRHTRYSLLDDNSNNLLGRKGHSIEILFKHLPDLRNVKQAAQPFQPLYIASNN